MAPTPEKYVKHTLKTIGLESCTSGYLPHGLLVASVNVLRYICEKGTLWLVCKTMCNIRKRALKKKEKILEKITNEETSFTTK